ncbi:universal stress protein [Streptomyces ovatisporus]|uniref:Universal stress protein n=1 Tax=Streptomyces ovatisporus TaxID=1128682 RepID=A0ABV9A6K9_9ACTN
MSESVTVGVDGTRESHSAVDWAAREALVRGVTLQLLQVRETGVYPYSPIADDEVEREWAQHLVNELLDELHRRHPELNVTVETASGRPSHVLADVSAETDLLVLGSSGLSSLLGFIVGSAALPTVAHSACPVVLVRARPGDDHGAGDHDGSHGRTSAEAFASAFPPPETEAETGEIVLGVDLQRPCDELLAFAFGSAARRSVPLRVLNAWNLGGRRSMRPTPIPPGMHGELLTAQNDALAAALRPWTERHPDIKVHAEALVEQPAHLLVEAATQASMLIVGRRNRRSRIGTHLGPVTHAVMHHARAPLAIVPYD